MTYRFLFENNAATTLAEPLAASSGATTVTLATGTGADFPNPSSGEVFTLTLTDALTGTVNEITWCTARSGDVCTVLRGQEGTAIQPWAIGDNALNLITAAAEGSFAQAVDVQEQAGNYAVDTGSANAVVIALTPAPATLAAIEGAPIRFQKASAANTGATTLAIGSLAATAITWHGAALPGGALVAGAIYEVIYDGASFELLTSPAFIGGAGTYAYGVDTGSASAIAVALSPEPAAYAAGEGVAIKVANTNAANVTIAIGSLAATNVTYQGQPLWAGALQASQIYLFTYDGTEFQLVSSPAISSNGYQGITYPGTTPGDVGSSGWRREADGRIVFWGYVQMYDYGTSAETTVTWDFPSGAGIPTFVDGPQGWSAVNVAAAAGQGYGCSSAVLSLSAFSSTSAGFWCHNSDGTHAVAWYIEVWGY